MNEVKTFAHAKTDVPGERLFFIRFQQPCRAAIETPIQDLFWFGQGADQGLTFLMRERATIPKHHQGMWIGVAFAFWVTVLTWLVAGGMLNMLAWYGEMLEAVVLLIAVGVLLLMLNWFFHKVYSFAFFCFTISLNRNESKMRNHLIEIRSRVVCLNNF